MDTSRSLQNIFHHHHEQLVPLLLISKSLPNIYFSTLPNTTPTCTSSTHKKQSKLLKKTWDKVKTVIMTSGHSSHRRTNSSKTKPSINNATSEESTKIVQEKSSDNSYDDDQIHRNYALLQKRLSEELQRSVKLCQTGNNSGSNNTDHLSEGFLKKLQEWECMKTGKTSSPPPTIFCDNLQNNIPTTTTTQTKKQVRKKKDPTSSKQKELAWLEKQLEKIEQEKKRLEREMKKIVEKEARLEKMKQALLNNTIKDRDEPVWIKTPTAKCKVENITEKSIKRLYQWEEQNQIRPESSTMALLNPIYYQRGDCCDAEESDTAVYYQNQTDTEEGTTEEPPIYYEESNNLFVEGEAREAFNETRYDDDTPAFSSTSRDQSTGRHDQEEHPRGETPSSSSSDFEEAEDSFLTHEDKGHSASGASNTDSDFFYRGESHHGRRRSSEATSTPLSARSPSPSADFTSDDDENENAFALRTVTEEENEFSTNNTSTLTATTNLKDAQSQTEVILKAKPILVGDEDECDEDDTIFVQTKRTIFTPIISSDEIVSSHLIHPLKSPSLVKCIINQSIFTDNASSDQLLPLTQTTSLLPDNNSDAIIVPQQLSKPPAPPPRVIELFPKQSPGFSGYVNPTRPFFPRMGNCCSPLLPRRPLNFPISSEGAKKSQSTADFTLDRFLEDTNLVHRTNKVESASTSQIPPITPRLFRRNTSATPTTQNQIQNHEEQLQTKRSSSFRFRRSSEQIHLQQNLSNNVEMQQPTTSSKIYSQLRSLYVTKSQSTGSIKSKIGKAFTHLTNKISSHNTKGDHDDLARLNQTDKNKEK